MIKMKVTPYQNKNRKSAAYGKWFMRPLYNTTLNTNDMNNHMQMDSKIERSMVGAVNNAISRQIAELLCNGHPIKIPHLGTLKLGASSKGKETAAKYNAGNDIKGVHLIIVPDAEIKAELNGDNSYVKYYKKNKRENP